MRHRLVLVPTVLALLAPAWSVAAADPSPSPEPWGQSCAVPASPAPMATPDCGGTPAAIPTAVISVDGEVYRIELIAPGALEGAVALITGESAANIPTGVVVRDDPGPNAPWSWHIDPATFAWAEVTTEVCDGLPTQIQDGVLTGERFCPWSAQLLAIEGDPGAPRSDGAVDRPVLPFVASGGTGTSDRTVAQRLSLVEPGPYQLRIETGANLDLTVSGCPAEVRLINLDRTLALGSVSPYPLLQPNDRGELNWPDLAAGTYDLYLSLDCAWAITFDRVGSSAS